MTTSTGYSGLFQGHHGDVSYSTLTNKTGNIETRIARAAANKQYDTAALAETTIELTGAAVGANTALNQHKRTKAEVVFGNDSQGGLREIETVDNVNRITSAADETRIDDALALSSQPSTYPDDVGGNGGGGKLGV